MALCFSNYSNAQVPGTVDPTTGLVIQETSNLVLPNGWLGQDVTTNYSGTNPRNTLGCCTGGPGALVDPTGSGYIWFAYSSDTVSQSIPFSSNLSGSGLRVSGINYGFQYYNQDFNRGSLSSTLNVTNNTGSIIGTVTTSLPQTTQGWTNFSSTYSLNSALLSTLGNATLSFTGKDDRFWAGYYGPAVRDTFVRFAYTVDPCATNPAYSPSCTGFNSVVTTSNVVPYPEAVTSWGGSINNSYAIQVALSEGGSGLKVHGFDWGYRVHSREPYCAFWVIFCFDNRDPLVRTNVAITNSGGSSLYSITRDYNDINDPQNFNYSYRFPTSQNLGSLGNFNFTAQTWDDASISNMYSRILYTPDLCIIDPLSSPTCPTYFQVLASQNTQTTSSDTVSTTPQQTTVVDISPLPQTQTQITSIEQSAPAATLISGSTTTQVQSSVSTTNLSPTVNNPQPKVGEVQQSSAPKTTVSLATVLSIISTENTRLTSVERSAVETTIQQAVSASASSLQQAESIAASSSTQNLGSGIQISSQQSSTNISSAVQATGVGISSVNLTQNNRSTNARSTHQETNNEKDNIHGADGRTESQSSSVNQKVRDNELAGGITLASISTQPVGFELYMNALKDAAFYPPKEIYKGQQNVDNARLLRGLTGGSDKLHEQMMELQYK